MVKTAFFYITLAVVILYIWDSSNQGGTDSTSTVLGIQPTWPTMTSTPLMAVVTTSSDASPTSNVGVVNRNSNIRQGPGTGYPVSKTASNGVKVIVIGYTNCDRDIWYQVETTQWIAGFLVDGEYFNVPYIDVECKFPVAPAVIAAATPKPNCIGGCTQYPGWCAPPIKGNVGYNSGEKIYHVPGQDYYDETIINPSYGERWFCTEQEAQSAGWRKAINN